LVAEFVGVGDLLEGVFLGVGEEGPFAGEVFGEVAEREEGELGADDGAAGREEAEVGRRGALGMADGFGLFAGLGFGR